MNSILNLDNYQEKELLVLLKNVFKNYIKNILLLNLCNNNKKKKLIFKKYKLDNKFQIYLILFNNMIFIFDNNKYKNNILILLLLKWNQLIQIQKI